MLKLSDEYLKDVLVRLAHHSTAIEGNTLSLPQTVSIILENSLPQWIGASTYVKFLK
ncbi:MAG: hypothetical protein ABF820_10440 [Sporolactobacillus sp.]